MTFDPYKFAKGEDLKTFDPYAFAAGAKEAPTEARGRPTEAAATGFLNRLSSGHGPQLQALADPLIDRVTVPIVNALTGTEQKPAPMKQMLPGSPEYIAARDKNIRHRETLYDQNPIAYGYGATAGTLVQGAALSGLLPAKIAGSSVLGAMNTGAASGLLENPGDTEGEVSGLQIGKRGTGGLVGAAIGGTIQGGLQSAKHVKNAAGWVGRKVGSALTGESDDVIRTYAQKTDEVNRLIQKSGGNMSEAADQVRAEVQSGIRSTKAKLSGDIGRALEASSPDRNIPAQPIIDVLEAQKAKLNPNFKADAISEINEMIANVSKEAQGGLLDLKGLHQTTQYLQESAKSSYPKAGQIFSRAGEAARAAKQAAALSRKTLNPLAPEVAKANNQLSLIHSIEENLNKNLIAPGKPDAALFAAGSGGNPRNAKMLDTLGKHSGVDALGKAKTLAAARSFASPSIMPTDSTGKSLTRVGVAAGLGSFAGPIGAVIGGAAASPLTLKAGINAVNIVAKGLAKLPDFSGLIQKNPSAANAVIQALSGKGQFKEQEINPDTLQFFLGNPQLLDKVQDPTLKAIIERKISSRKPSGSTAIERRFNKN